MMTLDSGLHFWGHIKHQMPVNQRKRRIRSQSSAADTETGAWSYVMKLYCSSAGLIWWCAAHRDNEVPYSLVENNTGGIKLLHRNKTAYNLYNVVQADSLSRKKLNAKME